MRRIGWLAVFLTAAPLASWASSSVDFQNFQGKDLRSGMLASEDLGFNPSKIQSLNGNRYVGVLRGVAFQTDLTETRFKRGDMSTGGTRSTKEPVRNGIHLSRGSVDIALPVPEPGTLLLLGTGAGLVGLAGIVRRRRQI